MQDNGPGHTAGTDRRWQLIEDIQGHASIEESDLIALRRILLEINRGVDLLPQERLMRGFITYHFGEALALNHTCEDDLLATLSEDPTNGMALMYLGYQCFDEGRFEEAKSYFERLTLSQHDSNTSKLRRMKICELTISCSLMMHHFDDVAKPLADLVQALREADPGEVAAPVELIRSLSANATDFRKAIRSDQPIIWIRHLRRIAKDHGVEQSLKYDLNRIDRAFDVPATNKEVPDDH